jgi:GLPGLI family protein
MGFVMKYLGLILLSAIFSNNLFSQVEHFEYNNNIHCLGSDYNIIKLNDDKTIAYCNPNSYVFTSTDTLRPLSIFIYDHSKNKYKQIEYLLNKNNKLTKLSIQNIDWISLRKSSRKKENSKIDKGLACSNKFINFEGKITFEKAICKQIMGYNCFLAIISTKKSKYEVWYTNDISLVNAFPDILHDIPGTIILVNENDNTLIKLKESNSLSYEKIILSKENIISILSEW